MPVLVLNPRSDRGFVELVERLAADCGGTFRVAESSADEPDPERLLERLRWWYPRIKIRRRYLGRTQPEAWYVYRDGVPVPEEPVVSPETSISASPGRRQEIRRPTQPRDG